MGKLFFGDNLDMLREHVKDESVDLVYLDPPFNSKAQYNVLFKSPAGVAADAQLEAFQDSWHWGEAAESAYENVISFGGSAAKITSALRNSLGEADMMAYLVMMGARLIELRRVLKSTGSLYLHCDPTASHYLKVLLDGIFGHRSYRSEITWKRSTSHGNVGRNYGNLTDTILFYTCSDTYVWNQQFAPLSADYIGSKFNKRDDDGRRWQSVSLRNPSVRPNLQYDFLASNGHSYSPHANGWAVGRERMSLYDREGRLHYPTKVDGQLRLKQYLDERPGTKLQNLWDDIPAINSQAQERIGYPTQKPIALLDRMLRTSCNEGDLILDPFCGCGTTVHAAERLGRQWVGIDITHHAVTVIEDRLKKHFPGLRIDIEGRPRDLAAARDLARRDKYQFQWWANWLFGVDQYRERKKGADRGIDGERFFLAGPGGGVGRIIISVKGGEHVGVEAVRDLRGVLERERAELGVLVTLAPHTRPMITEAASLGFYDIQGGRFPRLQLVAVGDLFAGRRPLLPVRAPFEQLRAAVPKAKKRDDRQLTFTFAIDGGRAETPSGDVVVLDPTRRSTAA